jgi:hypothetical protein
MMPHVWQMNASVKMVLTLSQMVMLRLMLYAAQMAEVIA